MFKKVLVLGMAVVTLLCGCGSDKTAEAKMVRWGEEEFSSDEAHFVHTCYPAVEHILGEEVRMQEVKMVGIGYKIDGRLIDFMEIDNHIAECEKCRKHER